MSDDNIKPVFDVNGYDLWTAFGYPQEFSYQVKLRYPLTKGNLVLQVGYGNDNGKAVAESKLGMNLAASTGATVFIAEDDADKLAVLRIFALALEGFSLHKIRLVLEKAHPEKLPYGDGLFDMVFTSIMHMQRDRGKSVLREMIRVSRGAVLCLSPHALNKKEVELAIRSGVEQFLFTTQSLEDMFLSAGLVDIETTLLTQDKKPPDSRADWRTVFVMGRKKHA